VVIGGKGASLFTVMAGLDPAIHASPRSLPKNVDARDKPGHDETDGAGTQQKTAYAVAMSGKTASILVFSVAALNGLTM
jgi:hypothetical protein